MERTEIDELIEQALAAKKRWRKPKPELRFSDRNWQEVLDNRSAPRLTVSNL